jgi:hypothetical protein
MPAIISNTEVVEIVLIIEFISEGFAVSGKTSPAAICGPVFKFQSGISVEIVGQEIAIGIG